MLLIYFNKNYLIRRLRFESHFFGFKRQSHFMQCLVYKFYKLIKINRLFDIMFHGYLTSNKIETMSNSLMIKCQSYKNLIVNINHALQVKFLKLALSLLYLY